MQGDGISGEMMRHSRQQFDAKVEPLAQVALVAEVAPPLGGEK